MSHARVEEVSDSDVSDPEEMDVDTLAPDEVIRAASAPASKAPQISPRPAQPARQAGGAQQVLQPTGPSMEETEEDRRTREAFKKGISLYPIYFDAARSKKEGRRVGKEHAVVNPLAREIAEAAYELGYRPNLEPSKMHPKDWANPGRVRVLGKPNIPINNKHHMYIKIAEWLKAHPTTATTSLKMPVQGLPRKAPEPPAVPRGWKMNKFLPMHSPAVSGGGVSENMLEDMKNMMQHMGGPGGEEPPQIGGSQKKKDKKNKK